MKFAHVCVQLLVALGLSSNTHAFLPASVVRVQVSSRIPNNLPHQHHHQHQHQYQYTNKKSTNLQSANIDTNTNTKTSKNKAQGTRLEFIQEQEQDLLEAIQSYKNSNSIDQKPNPSAFTSLIQSWLTFPQPRRAEHILDMMEELYTPSGRIYERIINAWSFAAVERTDQLNLLVTSSKLQEQNQVQVTEEEAEKRSKQIKFLREEAIYCSSNAVSLLTRMEQLYEEIPGADFRPALSTYTSVINSIARTAKLSTTSTATTTTTTAVNASTTATTESNEDLLEGQAQAQENIIALEQAQSDLNSQREIIERIRSRRDDIYKQRNDVDLLKIRVTSIQHVLDILEYFREQEYEYSNGNNSNNGNGSVNGNIDSNGNVDGALGSGSEIAPHELFARLKLDSFRAPIPNRFNFNLIINALAQTGEMWAAQAAENILDFMFQQCTPVDADVNADSKVDADSKANGAKSNGRKSKAKRPKSHPQLTPSIETINGCINAWAHCTPTVTTAPSRAEAILEKLNALQQMGKLADVTPDNVSYNTIIKAYANGADAKRAEAILEIMVELYQSTGDEKIKPDIISYSSVLNAYAKAASKDPNASKKSEEILMQMVKMQEEEDRRLARTIDKKRIVNTWCFNTVLNAYAVQGAGSRASTLLAQMESMSESDEMLKPDTYSFNTVLKALANSKEKGSVDRARQILDKMEERYATGDISVKPDAISYNTVILAYANNGGMRTGAAATAIVKRMEDRFLNGDLDVKPTSPTYTSLIKALNWERESTRQAEEAVSSLLNNPISGNGLISPDTAIFNALLNCWAKSGSRGATQRAEEILAEMKREYRDNGNSRVKPNSRTYTTVIDVLSKSGEYGSASRSLEILDEMERIYKQGDKDAKPNVYTYTTVINCFARSKEVDKAVKAVDVLQRMEEQYRQGNEAARPNVIAYNSVLNACAYTPDNAPAIETAFKIACLVFDEVRTSDYVQPSHVTYGTFMSVCANLMPQAEIRDNLVEATFKRCARNGLVSKMVWRNFKAAASPVLLGDILEQANSGLEATWSRNV